MSSGNTLVLKKYPVSLKEPNKLLALLRRQHDRDKKKADLGIGLNLILVLHHFLAERP